MDRWKNGQVDGEMDGRMGGWMERWMDGSVERWMYRREKGKGGHGGREEWTDVRMDRQADG